MIEAYRGDTFARTVIANNFTFEVGDTIRIGAKSRLNDSDYIFLAENTFSARAESFDFAISAETMAQIKPNVYIFEIELTHAGETETVLQEQLAIKGDVLNE